MIKNFWFRFVLTLLLVLAMMTVIFIMSDQDAENSSESSGMIVDFVIRIIFKDFDKMEQFHSLYEDMDHPYNLENGWQFELLHYSEMC